MVGWWDDDDDGDDDVKLWVGGWVVMSPAPKPPPWPPAGGLGRVRVAAATIILSSHTHIHQLGLLVLGRRLISISARIFFYPSHHSSSMENQSVFTLKELGRKKCYKHYNESHEIDDNRETTAMDFLYFVNKVLFSTWSWSIQNIFDSKQLILCLSICMVIFPCGFLYCLWQI